MRLQRRSAASAWLNLGLAASPALGLGALVALACVVLTSGLVPAMAAVGNPPANTVASVVPSAATPGSRVTFAVSCAHVDTASATLSGRGLGLPDQVPMDATAGGGDFAITVILPQHIKPAIYRPAILCSDGTSTRAALTVTAFAAADVAHTSHSTTSTTGLATAGLILIGVGIVAGGIAMRRRSISRSSGPR
jgi:hypothetical protein